MTKTLHYNPVTNQMEELDEYTPEQIKKMLEIDAENQRQPLVPSRIKPADDTSFLQDFVQQMLNEIQIERLLEKKTGRRVEFR